MGTLIKAVCQSCDFRKQFRYGFGMVGQGRNLSMPALSSNGKFEIVNANDALPNGYRLYTNQELFDFELTEENGIEFSGHFLSPVNNYCPNCKKKNMDFNVYGHFD